MRLNETFCMVAGLLGALAVLPACGDADPDETPPDPESDVVMLTPAQHLVRASMALRGMRPSVEELERVQADPDQLEAIVDDYLDSPEFGRTIRQLHDETLLLRPDWLYYPAGFTNVGALSGYDLNTINDSVMDAPLRLIEDVVTSNRPYSEIVTAEYTMANKVGAIVWDLPFDASGPEWQKTHYQDGRGDAGILTDSWLYVRYQSTPSNANRQRANAISRSLLCYDFLSRDVELDANVDVSDPNAVQDTVVANQACASCHQALDPLASFFKDVFPIVVPQNITEYPAQAMWFPGVFEDYLQIDMREPSYFGQAGSSLPDLGALIADDPRFSLCAAKHFYSYFNQVRTSEVPLESAAELQSVLDDSGMSAKALAKAVVLSDDFRTSHATSDEAAETLVGLRKARPDELASMIEGLTGFRWMTDLGAYTDNLIGKIELPRDSMIGYRVIGGGIDGAYVTTNTFTDNAGTNLFMRAFAEEAAAYAVDHDFAEPDPSKRKLLGKVDATTTDETAIRDQVAELHARIFGELVDPDGDEVTELVVLLGEAFKDDAATERAWKTLLVAMMTDVRVSYY